MGSKNFTEQLILGKIAVILLKSAGAEVTDLTNIPGSASARLRPGRGPGRHGVGVHRHRLDHLPRARPSRSRTRQKQYEAVRDEDLEENGLVWLPPAPMNNTYGFATPTETARGAGDQQALGDRRRCPSAERTFCVESEFKNRNDGFEPMLEAYDVPLGKEVPAGNVKTLATGAIYAATDQGDCNFGEIFTTDGRIKALDLTVLEDDRDFFPVYNVAPVFREQVLDERPAASRSSSPRSPRSSTTRR